MNVKIAPTNICGKVQIISSKSELHRLLILSALCSDQLSTTVNFVGSPSRDVIATVKCLKAIGVGIERTENSFTVTPIKSIPDHTVDICPDESGSTLRFLLPVFSALGLNYRVTVNGRLGERPLSPLYELMTENGVKMSENGKYPLTVKGSLTGNFEIAGNVSSQFISGLMMALPIIGGGTLKVTGEFQSKPYVDITVGAMQKFGVTVTEENNTYTVVGKYRSVGNIDAGGDWSNGAFFLSLGAIKNQITVSGLDKDSFQGDRAVVDVLSRFGSKLTYAENGLTATPNALNATEIDASNIPDLIPILSVVAAVSKGQTTVINAGRLRLKESDRISSVVNMLNALGGNAVETKEGIIINGKPMLNGGTVDGAGDHRIVMSASIASAVCDNPVTIIGAQAVDKSYPQFFEIMKSLGFEVKEM